MLVYRIVASCWCISHEGEVNVLFVKDPYSSYAPQGMLQLFDKENTCIVRFCFQEFREIIWCAS